MKQFFITLFSKAYDLLEDDPATRDRSIVFRVTILTLLSGTILFIVYNVFKAIN